MTLSTDQIQDQINMLETWLDCNTEVHSNYESNKSKLALWKAALSGATQVEPGFVGERVDTGPGRLGNVAPWAGRAFTVDSPAQVYKTDSVLVEGPTGRYPTRPLPGQGFGTATLVEQPVLKANDIAAVVEDFTARHGNLPPWARVRTSTAHESVVPINRNNVTPKKPYRTPADAKIGWVIGTHASYPYVHLGLEAMRRYNPNVEVLVHDDSSEHFSSLSGLSAGYAAYFVTTQSRRAVAIGDMSAFCKGLRWGEELGLDIVVKASRRFIVFKPFEEALRELMHNTGYATATAPCAHFSFGYRSELVAMAVRPWIDSGACAEMEEMVRQNVPMALPEDTHHKLANRVHLWNNPKGPEYLDDKSPKVNYLVRSEHFYNRPENYDGFAWWPLMGMARTQTYPGVLWHDSHEPASYSELANEFGLMYGVEDFRITPGE